MKETTDSSALDPHALTLALARANVFSFDSLDANHAGHLSSQQMKVVLETFGFAILIPVCFLGMIGAGIVGFLSLQQGFSEQNVGSMVEGVIFIIVAVMCLVGTGLLINRTKSNGTDKYLSERRIRQLLQMPIDLVRGRVAMVEGSTIPHVEEISTNDHDGTGNTNYYYSYSVAGTSFGVDYEGYRALPKWGAQCRVYYLPWSKAMLNIEVMDTASLNVEVPDTATDEILKTSGPAAGGQTVVQVTGPNRRTAHAQSELAAADSIARPLAVFAARLAFGNSKATEIQSRLSDAPPSMSADLTASPVYTQALQVAGADSHVLAELGEPIQPLPGVTGSTSRKNDPAMTELVIPISGARKHGTLYVTARQNKGAWDFYRLEVKVDGKAEFIPLGG